MPRASLAGHQEQSIVVDDLERRYLLFVPSSAAENAPLIVMLHGAGTHGGVMPAFTGMSELATIAGFVVMYPSGTGRTPTTCSWNASNHRYPNFASRAAVDDVKFIAAAIEHAKSTAAIAPQAIFAAGFSNGGMFAYRLAIEMYDTFRAVASVAGPMLDASDTVAPGSMPVCHLHGEQDEHVPLAGGIGRRSLSKMQFPSMDETIEFWKRANRVHPVPSMAELATIEDDGTRVTRKHFRGANSREQVLVYTIAGCGHTWPGRSSPFSILGKATRNLDASRAIWDFFLSTL